MSGREATIWPIEPPPTSWQLPDPNHLDAELVNQGLVGVGADLEPGTVLAAYRRGLFPMHVDVSHLTDIEDSDAPLSVVDSEILGWWSPVNRGILPLGSLRVSRSLRRSRRRFMVTLNQAFADVVSGCADPRRTGQWINDQIVSAYQTLHEMGWAHSVEVWEADELVGGLYGVAVGGLFAGESMFSVANDASKVALVHLVELLSADGANRLIDVQWSTDHLASLGAVEVPRATYQDLLEDALELPIPAPLLHRT